MLLVGVATTKIWLSIRRSANWALCKVHYFRKLMINFQLYFILIYLKIIINAECLQYLPQLTQQPDKKNKKKKNKTKHGNEKLQRASWYLHQIVKNSIHKYSMYQIS